MKSPILLETQEEIGSLATRYGRAIACLETLAPELEHAYRGRRMPERTVRRLGEARALVEQCDATSRARFREMDLARSRAGAR